LLKIKIILILSITSGVLYWYFSSDDEIRTSKPEVESSSISNKQIEKIEQKIQAKQQFENKNLTNKKESMIIEKNKSKIDSSSDKKIELTRSDKKQTNALVNSFSIEAYDEDWRYFEEEHINLKMIESEILGLTVESNIECKSTMCKINTISDNIPDRIKFLREFFKLAKENNWEPHVTNFTGNNVELIIPRRRE